MVQQVRTLSIKSEFHSQNPDGGNGELTPTHCPLPSVHIPWHACSASILIQRERETEAEAEIERHRKTDTCRNMYGLQCRTFTDPKICLMDSSLLKEP